MVEPCIDPLSDLSGNIIGAAIEVHRHLGPGLLESMYQECLAWELVERGLKVEKEKPVPLSYKGLALDASYRLDLLVENKIVVEVKTVEGLLPVHDAQLLTYLKLTGCKLGLLLNFNVDVMRNGIRRIAHGI